MKTKLLQSSAILCFALGLSGPAMSDSYFPDPEFVSPINVNSLTYQFDFSCVDAPSETFGTVPNGVEELQGGVLFLQHTDGNFNLVSEAVGVFIDDVYFGSVYAEDHPTALQAIRLDWHQLNSIASDGVATVRIENSPTICPEPISLSCPVGGSMVAWFEYDGVSGSCSGDGDGDGDGVPDGVDQCPDTPEGAITNEEGCAVEQLCPCDREPDWRNHGKYVSCVAQAAASQKEQGLITGDEMDEIVSSAAKSNCGHRGKKKVMRHLHTRFE